MGLENFLRQTVRAARSASGKIAAGHDFLAKTLGEPLQQLRQVPGVGDILKSYDPLAKTLARASNNLGQFSRGEQLSNVPTVRDYESGISEAKQGTRRALDSAAANLRIKRTRMA
jgi:hypothetical protein